MQNNESKKESLLNCPFCGGEAKVVYDSILNRQGEQRAIVLIRCEELNCTVRPKTQWHISEEEAIEHWNTRKPMERIVEELEEEHDDAIYHAELDPYYTGMVDAYEQSIEIVRNGGKE